MINFKELEEEIKKIIEPIVNQKDYPVYEDEPRKIKIYTGILPPDPEKTIIPAITIKTLKAKNTLDRKVISLIISIGIFEEDIEKGYVEIAEITQNIFDKLMEIGIIKERFEILPEADWEFPEAQPYPFYLSFININIVYEKDYRNDLEDWMNGKE